ncbi:MAG: hypothetical protein II404_05505 [Prevotella sp.]|nr:hypothetical protein [Prevotella sp.]
MQINWQFSEIQPIFTEYVKAFYDGASFDSGRYRLSFYGEVNGEMCGGVFGNTPPTPIALGKGV